ncbi:hypothetical protein TcWFU_007714 [Taenia crassiceps]|uniref:Uncharacterized protein n=1 Tax=Taenia crassiceps TaxID=6207 RepID=A0ABR4Q557_9CEST
MTLLPPNHWRLLQLHKALEVMMSSDAVVAMSSSHLDRARRCLTSGGSALHCCCHKMKEREDGQCSEDGREGGREGGREEGVDGRGSLSAKSSTQLHLVVVVVAAAAAFPCISPEQSWHDRVDAKWTEELAACACLLAYTAAISQCKN